MKLTKADIAGAVRFLDEGGDVAKVFRESLEATGVMAHDLMMVAAATTAMLNAGLTRDTLILLIQSRMKNQRNGRPFPSQSIDDVLTAMENLDQMVDKTKLAVKPSPVERAK